MQLDRYVLIRKLGSGATGEVWRAKCLDSDLVVACKVLHPEARGDERTVAGLKREAQILSRLKHPNITQHIEFSTEGAHAYLVMECVEGESLDELMASQSQRGRHFPATAIRALFQQLCDAVECAHKHQVIHRDIKPRNIIVSTRQQDEWTLKVLDFGIARLVEGNVFDATTVGRSIGSPMYWSPEQINGRPATIASDVFAMATVLFELVTLHRPWLRNGQNKPLLASKAPVPVAWNNLASVMYRIALAERPKVRSLRPSLSQNLEALIDRSLSIEPKKRPSSVSELFEEAWPELKRLTDAEEVDASSGADDTTTSDSGGWLAEQGKTILNPEASSADDLFNVNTSPEEYIEGTRDDRELMAHPGASPSDDVFNVHTTPEEFTGPMPGGDPSTARSAVPCLSVHMTVPGQQSDAVAQILPSGGASNDADHAGGSIDTLRTQSDRDVSSIKSIEEPPLPAKARAPGAGKSRKDDGPTRVDRPLASDDMPAPESMPALDDLPASDSMPALDGALALDGTRPPTPAIEPATELEPLVPPPLLVPHILEPPALFQPQESDEARRSTDRAGGGRDRSFAGPGRFESPGFRSRPRVVAQASVQANRARCCVGGVLIGDGYRRSSLGTTPYVPVDPSVAAGLVLNRHSTFSLMSGRCRRPGHSSC